MNKKELYQSCFYCDNLVSPAGQVGLLYLGFPRCMVLIPDAGALMFSTYEEFVSGLVAINWLDPSDKGTSAEQEEVLTKLWNFAIEQEAEEDRICEESEY